MTKDVIGRPFENGNTLAKGRPVIEGPTKQLIKERKSEFYDDFFKIQKLNAVELKELTQHPATTMDTRTVCSFFVNLQKKSQLLSIYLSVLGITADKKEIELTQSVGIDNESYALKHCTVEQLKALKHIMTRPDIALKFMEVFGPELGEIPVKYEP